MRDSYEMKMITFNTNSSLSKRKSVLKAARFLGVPRSSEGHKTLD